MTKRLTKVGKTIVLFGVLLVLLWIPTYVWNIVKLCNQDFEAAYKNEVVHAIGVGLPPASVITVWWP